MRCTGGYSMDAASTNSKIPATAVGVFPCRVGLNRFAVLFDWSKKRYVQRLLLQAKGIR